MSDIQLSQPVALQLSRGGQAEKQPDTQTYTPTHVCTHTHNHTRLLSCLS